MRLTHVLVVAATLSLAATVQATPMYAARSARTCENCHVGPNKWENPPLADRKCNMSCQSCHVDPAGGGMRNTSGRFFRQSTLPMVATSPRPTDDWDRNGPYFDRRDRATSYDANLPVGPNTFAEAMEDSEALSQEMADGWARGTSQGKPSAYGLLQGRYERLNADPVIRVGADLRLAYLGSLIFPMQIDVPVAVHPVHHLTFLVNTGVRGRSGEYAETYTKDHSFYFREVFAMLHEAPYQALYQGGPLRALLWPAAG